MGSHVTVQSLELFTVINKIMKRHELQLEKILRRAPRMIMRTSMTRLLEFFAFKKEKLRSRNVTALYPNKVAGERKQKLKRENNVSSNLRSKHLNCWKQLYL